MSDNSLNWTARSSEIQGDKGVNDAACPLEGGPAVAGSLTASGLPLLNGAHRRTSGANRRLLKRLVYK